ncbi:MAG: hypothetical protein WDA71_14445 [Actinomycetota bacterium]
MRQEEDRGRRSNRTSVTFAGAALLGLGLTVLGVRRRLAAHE